MHNKKNVAQSMYLTEPFQGLWQAKDPFEETDLLTGPVYRELEGRKTLRFEHEGEGFFLKIHKGIGWGEIFKNLLQFRLPILGAKSEYLAINKLKSAQLKTMTVRGYGKRGANPAAEESFLITEALEPTQSLEDFCLNWRKNKPVWGVKQSFVTKLADITRRMHEAGINHRDYYLCHFLMFENSDSSEKLARHEAPDLYLIDLHRAQIRKKVPVRWLVKDLSAIFYSAQAVGFTFRDGLRFIAGYRQKHWRQVLKEESQLWHKIKNKSDKLMLKAVRKGFLPGK